MANPRTISPRFVAAIFFTALLFLSGGDTMTQETSSSAETTVDLPDPVRKGSVSVERALGERRSARDFAPAPVGLAEVSQLLWAAQGISGAGGLRTAPSAGALYPLEVTLIVGRVEDLPGGMYRYEPGPHRLRKLRDGDHRADIAKAAFGQDWISRAPLVLAFSAVYERTTTKYGKRGTRYVHMEVGHAGQNVYLQATALGLGTVTVGAFDDAAVKKIIGVSPDEQPLALMPVGRTR